MQFAEVFPDLKILTPLATQLSWSHFIELFPLKLNEAKMFYAQKALQESWGKRTLKEQINKKAYERAAIANTQIAAKKAIPFNAFKDPYLLDFLQMKNTFLETDLEHAILRELKAFILELGKGFAFMERQKRMIIDGEDFYLDLLFYNRNQNRLVAIELKIGKFEAGFKGQMELYLKWLDKHEKKGGGKRANRPDTMCRNQQRTNRTIGNAQRRHNGGRILDRNAAEKKSGKKAAPTVNGSEGKNRTKKNGRDGSMSRYNTCFLKDIGESQTGPFGTQLHEEEYVKEGTPIGTVEHLGEIFFNLANLPLVSDSDKARLSKYLLKEGDIVFSRVGLVDRCT